MQFLSRVAALFILAVWLPAKSFANSPGTCISSDDEELLSLVDAYRVENDLNPVPWSRSLMEVGHWHVWDAINNDAIQGSCNLHSWSDDRPEMWTAMCYTPDHAQASLMWSKPSEISDDVYTGPGFENAAWGYSTVQNALNGWKNSPGHNNVILNLDAWSALEWKAMGVGTDTTHRWYFLWFSTETDPRPEMPLCNQALIFKDGFED